MQNLQAGMAKNKIDFAIVLAAYFPRKIGSISNEQVISATKDYDNIIVFGSLDVENNLEQGVEELRELLETEKIFGIKLYPGYQFFYPSDKKVDTVYKLALEFNVPVMFHSGLAYKSPGGIKYSRPIHFDDVAGKFPELRIIISHLGDPNVKEAVAVAQKNPNVYLDFSGLISNITKSSIKEDKWKRKNEDMIVKTVAEAMTDLMGTEKFIFGTDWPISSYESSLGIVDSLEEILELNKEEKAQILSGNILKVLGT